MIGSAIEEEDRWRNSLGVLGIKQSRFKHISILLPPLSVTPLSNEYLIFEAIDYTVFSCFFVVDGFVAFNC